MGNLNKANKGMNERQNLGVENMERRVAKNRGRKNQSIFRQPVVFKEGRGAATLDEDDVNQALTEENFNKLKA